MLFRSAVSGYLTRYVKPLLLTAAGILLLALSFWLASRFSLHIMKMAQCIIENGRAALQQTYPNPLYEGEGADSANKSAYPKTFDQPLTFELFSAHQALSEAAKP